MSLEPANGYYLRCKGVCEMLTKKQEFVLSEIIKYINKNIISPTVRELAKMLAEKIQILRDLLNSFEDVIL